MEGGSDDIVEAGGGCSGGSTAAAAGSRWNPTKEQISILENMYRQGIRTPSAEQIQEITTRLKAYGHIEGKNVFYWFQNHKARQRQKEKQESLAYINRCLQLPDHAATSAAGFLHPRTHHAFCGPYYVPRSDIGFYTQHPKSKMLLSNSFKRPRERSTTLASSDHMVNRPKSFGATLSLPDINPTPDYNNNVMFPRSNGNYVGVNGKSEDKHKLGHETLNLFPLHPTGIEQDGPKLPLGLSSSDNNNVSCSSEVQEVSSSNGQPFFDFFSG